MPDTDYPLDIDAYEVGKPLVRGILSLASPTTAIYDLADGVRVALAHAERERAELREEIESYQDDIKHLGQALVDQRAATRKAEDRVAGNERLIAAKNEELRRQALLLQETRAKLAWHSAASQDA